VGLPDIMPAGFRRRFHFSGKRVNQDLTPIRGYAGTEGTWLHSVASNQVA